jgi:hypothetical protein
VENLFHSLTFPGKVIGAVLFMCSIVILAGVPAILRYQQLAWRSDATRYQYLVFGSDVMPSALLPRWEKVKTSDQPAQAVMAQPAIRPLLFEILASASADILTPRPSGRTIDEQS